MFDEIRTAEDPLAEVLTAFEQWLDKNEYPLTEVSFTGELFLETPGLVVAGETDTVTVGYVPDEGGEPGWRSYLLEELWAMSEAELRAELEDLISPQPGA